MPCDSAVHHHPLTPSALPAAPQLHTVHRARCFRLRVARGAMYMPASSPPGAPSVASSRLSRGRSLFASCLPSSLPLQQRIAPCRSSSSRRCWPWPSVTYSTLSCLALAARLHIGADARGLNLNLHLTPQRPVLCFLSDCLASCPHSPPARHASCP